MKLISFGLTCIAIALIITGCTETATPTNTSTPSAATSPLAPTAATDQFATARANYEKNCQVCHGETGVGGLVKVANKQIKVPSLKAEHAVKHTDEQLADRITNGEQAMPAFKDKLRPEEITELVKFIRKEFQGQ